MYSTREAPSSLRKKSAEMVRRRVGMGVSRWAGGSGGLETGGCPAIRSPGGSYPSSRIARAQPGAPLRDLLLRRGGLPLVRRRLLLQSHSVCLRVEAGQPAGEVVVSHAGKVGVGEVRW
jgi:hypothetical protein